jgi:hypothetical protein
MPSYWENATKKISLEVGDLDYFRPDFWTEEEFIGFIDRMGSHFATYSNLWFLGYFDNSFAKKIEEHFNEARAKAMDVRVLSLPFGKDGRGKANKRTLEKLQRLKVEVRVNNYLHGRMALFFEPEPAGGRHRWCEIVLGSFDFNKDSLSGDKTNAGIHSMNPDLVEAGQKLFEKVWVSKDTLTIEEYTRDW